MYLSDMQGNALVIRLDCEPCEIHFLKSESCWNLDDPLVIHGGSLVCCGFETFLRSWVALAAPSTESLKEAISAAGGSIDEPPSDLIEKLDSWLGVASDPGGNEA